MKELADGAGRFAHHIGQQVDHSPVPLTPSPLARNTTTGGLTTLQKGPTTLDPLETGKLRKTGHRIRAIAVRSAAAGIHFGLTVLRIRKKGVLNNFEATRLRQ